MGIEFRKKEVKNEPRTSDLITKYGQKSRFAESIKTVRTNLAFSAIDKKNKVILITSPEPGDGKSFIASNLAVAYSQEGKNVLIIDADLRKGRQHDIFGLMNPTNGGYSNFILNYNDIKPEKSDDSEKEKKLDLSVDYYIIKTSINKVSLIPSGPVPPNPVELLLSKNNARLLADLKKDYDIIILDCPPIIGISDAMIMTSYSDVNLLVVSSNKTKGEAVEKSKKVFQQAKAKLDGVIINKAQVKGSSYYSNDYYYGDNE